MPLYEYQCEACEHRFEQIRKFSDPPLAECPTCGGPVRKLLSSPAIQFKGTGWYVTDYAKKATSGTEASEAGKASEDGGKKTEKKDGAAKSADTPSSKTADTKPKTGSTSSSGSKSSS